MKQGIEKFKELLDVKHPLILLYGGAGTGKSTTINEYLGNEILTSTTGVSALKIGGTTLHSCLAIDPTEALRSICENNYLPEFIRNKKFYLALKKRYLVIDEFSMMRYDLLNYIDLKLRATVRKYEKDDKALERPFGGLKVILVGDPFQLPPVAMKGDKAIFKKLNVPVECFKHPVISHFEKVKLTKIFRQSEIAFLNVLNNLRVGEKVKENIEFLNKVVKENNNLDSINICLTNRNANDINDRKIKLLNGESYVFKAEIDGVYEKKIYPRKVRLFLKEEAKVILIKNCLIEGKRYYNGTVGVFKGVTTFNKPIISIKGVEVVLPKQIWENIKYRMVDEKKGENKKVKRLEKVVLGTFEAYPFKVGYAITVHKSQGMTIEKANIDFERGTFATGQSYVALSRISMLKGVSLVREVKIKDVKVSKDALTIFG